MPLRRDMPGTVSADSAVEFLTISCGAPPAPRVGGARAHVQKSEAPPLEPAPEGFPGARAPRKARSGGPRCRERHANRQPDGAGGSHFANRHDRGRRSPRRRETSGPVSQQRPCGSHGRTTPVVRRIRGTLHAAPSPDADDGADVLATVEARVTRLLAQRGVDAREGGTLDPWAEGAPALAGPGGGGPGPGRPRSPGRPRPSGTATRWPPPTCRPRVPAVSRAPPPLRPPRRIARAGRPAGLPGTTLPVRPAANGCAGAPRPDRRRPRPPR